MSGIIERDDTLTLPEFHNLLQKYYGIIAAADQETIDRGFPYVERAKILHEWMQVKLDLHGNFSKKALLEHIRHLQTDIMTTIRTETVQKAMRGMTPPDFKD
jgi:hypothetical protein